MSTGDCDNDRQPKSIIAVFGAILPFQVVRRCPNHLVTLSCQDQNFGFAVGISTLFCHSFRDISISGFAAIFGICSLLKSPMVTFFQLAVVKNRRFAFGIVISSYLRRTKYFRFGWPYSYFRFFVVFDVTVFDIAVVNSARFAVEKKNKFNVFLFN